MNGLSVIIPSRNDANLDACVAAVKAHDPLDIIVIDDGLQRRYPPCTIQPFIYARNINVIDDGLQRRYPLCTVPGRNAETAFCTPKPARPAPGGSYFAGY